MNTPEVVSSVAENANLSKKEATAVVKSLTRIIHESLKKHGEIRIAGLGTFWVLELEGKEWRESSYPAQDANTCHEIAQIPCSQGSQRSGEWRRNEIRQEKEVIGQRTRLHMNKSDLIKALSREMDLPIRKAEEIVDMVFDAMSKSLVSGDRIEIRGFGVIYRTAVRRIHGPEPQNW